MKLVLFVGLCSLAISSFAQACPNLSGNYVGSAEGQQFRVNIAQANCEKIDFNINGQKLPTILADGISRNDPSFVPTEPADMATATQLKSSWNGNKLIQEKQECGSCYMELDGVAVVKTVTTYEVVGNDLQYKEENFGIDGSVVKAYSSTMKRAN